MCVIMVSMVSVSSLHSQSLYRLQIDLICQVPEFLGLSQLQVTTDTVGFRDRQIYNKQSVFHFPCFQKYYWLFWEEARYSWNQLDAFPCQRLKLKTSRPVSLLHMMRLHMRACSHCCSYPRSPPFSPSLTANNQILSERMTPGNWGIDIMTCLKQMSVSAYITVVIINWK